MRPLTVLLAAAALVAPGTAGAAAAPGAVSAEESRGQAPPTLIVRRTQYGPILFDGRSRVLYGFTRDRRGGPSRCYGACVAAWPVYYAQGAPRAGAGVRRSLISTTRRRDGRLQVTYNGWPLYYYANEGPREVRCQNVDHFGGIWRVVRPNGTLVR